MSGSTRVLLKKPHNAVEAAVESKRKATLFQGDCLDLLKALPEASVSLTISSPPYCMDKEYETGHEISDFIEAHSKVLPEIVRVTKPGGSICWQVGYHVEHGALVPLDYLIYDVLKRIPGLTMRNRVIWTFGHGLHCQNRFSGRHEVLLWYTKGDEYRFNLDAVRVPQKYPGKKSNKGPKKGSYSGNPKGKNPSDVWDMPNVKANHVEKTDHPCQFPVALAQRLVQALSRRGDLVLDPFAGSASSAVAALLEGRRFVGAELHEGYAKIAETRIRRAIAGTLKYRPIERPIHVPTAGEAVAKRPAHFWPDLVGALVRPALKDRATPPALLVPPPLRRTA